jgi:hypothetical protein
MHALPVSTVEYAAACMAEVNEISHCILSKTTKLKRCSWALKKDGCARL